MPAFPRYDLIYNTEKRLGLTGSVQYQPDDATLFTLDALFADFSVVRNEQYLEAPSFSANGVSSAQAPAGAPALLANALGIGSIAVTNYTVNERQQQSHLAQRHRRRPAHRASPRPSRHPLPAADAGRHRTHSPTTSRCMGCWAGRNRITAIPIQTTLTMDYDCTAATSDTGAVAGCPGGQGGGAGTAASPYIGQLCRRQPVPAGDQLRQCQCDLAQWLVSVADPRTRQLRLQLLSHRAARRRIQAQRRT